MSEVNKVVAAILTSGRMPTLTGSRGPLGSDDWLAEYNMWVEALDKQDAESNTVEASGWLDALKTENKS